MVGSEHIKHLPSEEPVHHHENSRHAHTPEENAFHGRTHGWQIPAADEFSGHCLSCISEAIDKIRENHHQLNQYRADSQHHIAITRRNHGNAGINRHYTERTQEQIGIEREKFLHMTVHECFTRIPHRELRKDLLAVFEKYHRKSEKKTGILRNQCSGGNAVETDAIESDSSHTHRQTNASDNVHGIDYQVSNHRTDTVLHPDEPALQGHESQCRRSRPDTDMEITLRERAYCRRTLHEQEHEIHENPLYQYTYQCNGHRHPDGTYQRSRRCFHISAPIGLSRHPAGPDTKKTEIPI